MSSAIPPSSGRSRCAVSAQLTNMLVALSVMWIFANIPPHYLMRLAVPVYVVGVLLLVATIGVVLLSNRELK